MYFWTPVDPFSGVHGPRLCSEGALSMWKEVVVNGAGVEATLSKGAAGFESTLGGRFEITPGGDLYFDEHVFGLISFTLMG